MFLWKIESNTIKKNPNKYVNVVGTGIDLGDARHPPPCTPQKVSTSPPEGDKEHLIHREGGPLLDKQSTERVGLMDKQAGL